MIGPPVAADFAAISASVSGVVFAVAVERDAAARVPSRTCDTSTFQMLRGARAQLLADVARRLDDRHAGGVTDAAAAGDVGEAGAVGVGDDRPDPFERNAEFLGDHHRLRGARAADVRIAGDHRGAAVAAEGHRGARAHAGVEPEAARQAAALVRRQRRLPVRVAVRTASSTACRPIGPIRRAVGRRVALR